MSDNTTGLAPGMTVTFACKDQGDIDVIFHGFFQHTDACPDIDAPHNAFASVKALIELPNGRLINIPTNRIRRRAADVSPKIPYQFSEEKRKNIRRLLEGLLRAKFGNIAQFQEDVLNYLESKTLDTGVIARAIANNDFGKNGAEEAVKSGRFSDAVLILIKDIEAAAFGRDVECR